MKNTLFNLFISLLCLSPLAGYSQTSTPSDCGVPSGGITLSTVEAQPGETIDYWIESKNIPKTYQPSPIFTGLPAGSYNYGFRRSSASSMTEFFGGTLVVTNIPIPPPTGPLVQKFCAANNPTMASLVTNEPGVIWYDAPTGGRVIPQTTMLPVELSEDYDYIVALFWGALRVGTCESTTRFQVEVNIGVPKTPVGAAVQVFCKASKATIASLVTNEHDVIWYDAAVDGNVITSSTPLENNKIYYGSSKFGTCESSKRLAVTVSLSDPQTPTGNATQEFCKSANATVASLVTNETGVTWYDAVTAGNKLASTTILTNGTVYYGSLKVGTCESPTRLTVTVTISDPQTPIGAVNQEFCKSANATVASLATNESGVTWYDAATAGNVVSSTTALVNGRTYYGSLKVGTCESPTRLTVTVTISDPQTPIGAVNQEFCKSANATVASLATNESGVTWYDAATAGNVVSSTTALVNGRTYYGSLKVGTCESPTRLAVTVTISDPQTPTGDATQEFLKAANSTVADLKTNEPDVVWYDASVDGKLIDSKTVLTDGSIYYGALKVSTCESPARLAVTVSMKTLGTPDFEFSNYFTLYPNPVSDVLTIKTKQDAEIQSLEVYDILGQLVIAVPNAKAVSTVDVSRLTTGSYFIKVKSNKGSSGVKFIKK